MPRTSLSFANFERGSRVVNTDTNQRGIVESVGPLDYLKVRYDDGTVEETTTAFFKPLDAFDQSGSKPGPSNYQTRPRVKEDQWKREGLDFDNFRE